MISCIVSDLDGTLLDGSGEISTKTKQAIQTLKQHGISFVVATGRDLKGAGSVFKGMDQQEYILLNGSIIMHQNQKVHECCLDETMLRQINAILTTYQIPCIYFTNKGIISNNKAITHQHFVDALIRSGMSQAEIEQMLNSDGFGDYADEITDLDTLLQQNYIVYKCEFYARDEVQYQELCQKLNAIEHMAISGWISLNIECTHAWANKGDALKAYARQQAIPMDQIVVLGDSSNDISMMKVVKHSIAMQNASDKVKAVAAYTLQYSHREDGVAYVIEQILERYGDQ